MENPIGVLSLQYTGQTYEEPFVDLRRTLYRLTENPL